MGCGDNPSNPIVNQTPVPTPVPTPTPTPVPTPTPAPVKATCQLEEQNDCGFGGCCSEGGAARFDGEIAAAQADIARTHPEIFDNRGRLNVDEKEYTDILADRIVQMTNGAVCAVGAGGSTSRDEIRVKRDNSLSQHVDVIIGSNNSPWVGGRYTCRPASF